MLSALLGVLAMPMIAYFVLAVQAAIRFYPNGSTLYRIGRPIVCVLAAAVALSLLYFCIRGLRRWWRSDVATGSTDL